MCQRARGCPWPLVANRLLWNGGCASEGNYRQFALQQQEEGPVDNPTGNPSTISP